MKIITSNNKNYLFGMVGKAGELNKYLKLNKNKQYTNKCRSVIMETQGGMYVTVCPTCILLAS